MNSLYIEGELNIMKKIFDHFIGNASSIFEVIFNCIALMAIVLLIVSGLQYSLYNTRSILIKHIILIIFVFIFGMLSYGLYKSRFKEYGWDIFKKTLMRLIGLLIPIIAIAYMFPQIFTSSLYTLIIKLMIITVIMALIDILLIRTKFSIIYIYITLLLFSILLAYGIRRILDKTKNCITPDYVEISLDIFSTLIVIFNDLLRISK